MKVAASTSLGLVAFSAVLTACIDESPTELPALSAWSATMEGYPTIDEEWARVAAEEAPGFAGFYQDGDRLVVRVTSDGDSAAARAYVDQMITGRFDVPTTIEVVRADFDWIALRDVAEALAPLFADGLINYLDISEADNAVVIGTMAPQVGLVTSTISALAMPAGSFLVRATDELRLDATLTDTLRPVRGGIQIQDHNSPACTLNVNAWIELTPVVIINSHCSGTAWALDAVANRPLYQPIGFGSNVLIGNEIEDRGAYLCWVSGVYCRRSDSAIYEVTSSDGLAWAHGQIARTLRRVKGSMGTDTISTSNPYFRIADEENFFTYSWVGGSIDRVGKVGGWTTTKTNATCVDRTVVGMLLKCLWRVDSPFNNGDSGAPYFLLMEPTSSVPTDVALQGIHIGSDTDGYYAPINGIEADFDIDLIVCEDLTC